MYSTREHVASLLAQGLTPAEVARRTGLASATVSYHKARLLAPPSEQTGVDAPEQLAPEAFLVPVRTRDQVHRLLRAGRSRAEVARIVGVSKSTVTYHARRFGMNIDARAARRYDWTVIQHYYDAGHTVRECRIRFGFSTASWCSAVKRGAIVARPKEMPLGQLLVAPRNRTHLKRRLIKAGLLATVCVECGIDDWRGIPLALELHHVNGNRGDNRLENLALLCPNCHSQTDTWGGRNSARPRGLELDATVR